MVVRALDGREAIIPNEWLIATTVLNHFRSNRHIRIALDLQIAYRSDRQPAMLLMEEAARIRPLLYTCIYLHQRSNSTDSVNSMEI